MTVVCGAVNRAAEDRMAAVNPVLLVEITSHSTEDYDRGEKLRHYQQLATVREVVIVSHRGPHVTVHRHEDDGSWSAREAAVGQTIELVSIAARIAVDEIYRDALEDTDG